MQKKQSNSEIIELFSFDDTIKIIFPFLNIYSEQIELWLTNNEFTKDQLFRFVIVGLLVEYFATSHQGNNFNTNLKLWKKLENRPETKRKLEIFNNLYGKEIKNSKEYLNLLTVDNLDNIELDGKFLFNYVIDNKL